MEDAPSLARRSPAAASSFTSPPITGCGCPIPAAMFRANVDGTRELMAAALAAGVERIVYTSSVATLGIVQDGVADEATPSRLADMIGPYKRSKFAAEEAVRELVAERGLPAVIVNPSTPIGPRDVKPTPTGRLILEAARGQMPAFVDTGLNIVHVDDVAAGHLLAAERGRIGERYILGGENLALWPRSWRRRRARRRPTAAAAAASPTRWRLPAAVGGRAVGAGYRARAVHDARRCSHVAKEDVFFLRESDARAGLPSAPGARAIADAVDWFAANGYLG